MIKFAKYTACNKDNAKTSELFVFLKAFEHILYHFKAYFVGFKIVYQIIFLKE
jgi:hypothetical protein